MADKILYTNKEELIDDESIPLKNKVTADDMNEIKGTVNSHADDIETLETEKADKTEIPTDLSELSNETTKFVNETQLANAVNDEKTQRQNADSAIINTIATLSVDYGRTIELGIDSSTFILTATLKNKNGATLNQSSIDLPLESVVVNGRYDSASKKIILTLQNGNTIEIPVGDLISGLQSEITPQNKLSSDLVDDTNHTNKFATQAEKNQIETNKNNITSLNENKENIANKVTELSSESTDTQYPSAKAVYDNESALKEKLDRYKNTIETELGDSTDTGTDLTLNGTAEFDVDLSLKGNTAQTQYEGYNLVDSNTYPRTQNYFGIQITNNGDGSFTLNGTCTGNTGIVPLGTDELIKEYCAEGAVTHTAYYISGSCTKVSTSATRCVIRLNYNKQTSMIPLETIQSLKKVTKLQGQSSDSVGWNWGLIFGEGDTFDNFTIKYMLEKGTEAHEWEKYTGGIPAPNPEYPQTVQVAKGNNEVKIENKNFLDFSKFTSITSRGLTIANTNGVITLKGTLTSGQSFARYELTTEKFLKAGNYVLSTKELTNGSLYLYLKDDNKEIASFNVKSKSSVTINLTADTVLKKIGFYANEVNTNYDSTIYPMLELNSTDTEFVIHKEQTYPITLPEGIEMCKIGDYADEFIYQDNTWYKNHKIYKFILTGNEDWTLSNNIFYISSGFPNYLMLENVNKVFCNKYLGIEPVYNASYVVDNNVCCVTRVRSLKRVYITDSRFNNVEDFKSYLVEQYTNNNPVIIYYILETPELEEITDTTLINQLNNIKEAYTYQGQTNITQTNEDLPFIIKADFKLSNLSRIEALESALETVSSRVDLLEE